MYNLVAYIILLHISLIQHQFLDSLPLNTYILCVTLKSGAGTWGLLLKWDNRDIKVHDLGGVGPKWDGYLLG